MSMSMDECGSGCELGVGSAEVLLTSKDCSCLLGCWVTNYA
jgi:hypothetical protein